MTRGCSKDSPSRTVAQVVSFEFSPRGGGALRLLTRSHCPPGPAPIFSVASLWAPVFCVASLYNIYSPPPNSFRAVLFRWLEEEAVGAVCLPHPFLPLRRMVPSGPSDRLCLIFSFLVWVVARGKEGNRHAEQKDWRTRRRVKEKEKERTNRKEGKRDYMVCERKRERDKGCACIFYLLGRAPRWGPPPLTAVSLYKLDGGPQSDTWKPKSRKLSLI